jgi:hypothetical protein
MPWPLAACLFDARSKEDLAQKADLVSSGKLGDIKDWQEAEKRWRHHGVNEDDISAISDQSWPFDSNIVRVGFPLGAWGWSTRSSGKVVELQSLLSKLHSLPNGKLKAWLASIIVDLLSSHGRFRWLGLPSGKDLRELLTLAIPMRNYSWFDFEELFTRVLRNGVSSEWIEFFDWLGRQDYVFVFSEEAPWIESLIHHFCAEPDNKTGLLPVIAAAAGPTKCKLPRAVLNAVSAWTGKARSNAILLTVARDDLTSDELRDLAKEVASREPEETSPWRLLHVASLASVKQGATLAIALLNQSLSDSEEAADIKQAAHRNLIEYLTKKPSNLGAPGTWADLHLPDRL